MLIYIYFWVIFLIPSLAYSMEKHTKHATDKSSSVQQISERNIFRARAIIRKMVEDEFSKLHKQVDSIGKQIDDLQKKLDQKSEK